MGQIIVSSADYWSDHLGRVWKVPAPGRLRLRYPAHQALQAFIFQRDGFRCLHCGAVAREIPADFGAVEPIWTTRTYRRRPYGAVPLVVDHRLSIRNGGTNHPDNLQSLCDCCNSAKAGLVDANGRAA